MNKHLNIFKPYTNVDRLYQLENDLTRAFAISLQEDALFFHELLKEVFHGTNFYNQLFESIEAEADISINIQEMASGISNYEHIFAITLSESEISDFWNMENNRDFDPICDLIIRINGICLIIETKRDNVDCTAQLYNQIFNIVKSDEGGNLASLTKEKYDSMVTPFDLNWKKLMRMAIKVQNFEKSFGNSNRFLSDFVNLVKDHNYLWLPEAPINSLKPNNINSILRRIDSAIIECTKKYDTIVKLDSTQRLGIKFSKGWADEIIFHIDGKGDLIVSLYPGNTKQQGYSLFASNPVFNTEISLLGREYSVSAEYHIKFTSFQRYFSGLVFGKNELKGDLYTRDNFHNFSGRKKREDWQSIEDLLNENLNYDWKQQCYWDDLIIDSGKSQFDISFGYEISIVIPFEILKENDKQSNVTGLVELINEIYEQFSNKLLE